MIYFVRHGLTEANIKRIFAGQKDDSLLTDEGREQAKVAAKKIIKEGIKIDKIYSSPLKRAYETAEIIAKELGFNASDIFIDNRVIEYDMGSLSGAPWNTISSQILINAENAENPQAFHDRIISCLKELNKFPGNVLLVSHGAVGRMLETIRENKDVKLFYDSPVYHNASITKIDWIK